MVSCLKKHLIINLLSTWQKIRYIDFHWAECVQKAVCNIVQSIFEQCPCSSSMFLNLDGADILVQVYSDFVAPHKGYADPQDQLFYSFEIVQVSFLYIEPTGFHGLEAHFYLPSLCIILLCLSRSVEGNDDKEFALLELASRNVAQLPVDGHDSVVVPKLTDL